MGYSWVFPWRCIPGPHPRTRSWRNNHCLHFVFYEDQFSPAPDHGITIDTELDLLQHAAQPLAIATKDEEEEKEDVHMTDLPSDMETPMSRPERSSSVGLQVRGDPRPMRSRPYLRRSSRVKQPSQRRIDFEASHLTMEEVCDFIKERIAPSIFNGSHDRDGCVYRELTNKELEQWARCGSE